MPAEHSERRRRIRVDRHTVGLGEQAVAIYPSVAHAEALLSLPPFVLLEQLDGNRGRFDVAGGAIVYRGPRHAPRGGERTNGDARSRHNNRICLPSTADEDEVSVMMPSCGMYSEARSMRMTEVLKSMSFHSSPQSSSRHIPVNINILIIVLNCISSPSISSRSLPACSSSNNGVPDAPRAVGRGGAMKRYGVVKLDHPQ